MNIPDKYKDCARELAEVAKRHNLSFLTGTFHPYHGDPWRDAIKFTFCGASHSPANMRIETTLREDVKL